jgi:hypothetical protein
MSYGVASAESAGATYIFIYISSHSEVVSRFVQTSFERGGVYDNFVLWTLTRQCLLIFLK